MARLKVQDLLVTERVWPLLVRASYKTDLLHISTHNGTWRNPSEYACDRFFVVTKCNRPFENTVRFLGYCGLSDYRLCSRCGTQADFEAALKAYEEAQVVYRLEQQKKEAERRAGVQRAAEVREQVATKIAVALDGVAFEAWADDGKVFVRYEGVLYRLPVMEEVNQG